MRICKRLHACALCAVASLSSGAAGAQRMKAIVYHEFGSPDVLRLEEIEKPVPNDDQILIKVHAASVNPLDWHYMEGTPYIARLMGFGPLEPADTRLGVDFAGTVESVGKNVTQFKPGDELFGGRTGAFAEYVCVRADHAMARKPANISFEQAASVPIAAITALQALRDSGKLQPGQKVLINGASGGVGTFAVQIAKSFGAEVTGVCSTRNLELVRSLGADHLIDYTKEDFAQGDLRYDVLLDNVANRSLSDCRRVLKPDGKYVLVGGGGVEDGRWVGPILKALETPIYAAFMSQQMGMMMANLNAKDLGILADLMQAGKVTPVIDRRYKLSDAAEAIRYLEAGHARGKVVISMDQVGDPAPVPAQPGKATDPHLILFTLIAVLLGVPGVPIVAAFVLNRRFHRRHPEKRSYRWGYYFGIQSLIAGIGLALLLGSGAAGAIACALVYALLAWRFVRRDHWAWIALTLLSFNPVAWIINYLYLRKRWREDLALP